MKAGTKLVISHAAMGVAAFALGGATARTNPPEGAAAATPVVTSGPVTGIGGVFFKSGDPAALLEWYRVNLGLVSGEGMPLVFHWRELDRPDERGYTVMSVFPDSTTYLSPGERPYMINLRVADLAGLVDVLRERGVEIVGGVEQHPNGSFAWILDPEGRKVELWEPVPSSMDPYLPR